MATRFLPTPATTAAWLMIGSVYLLYPHRQTGAKRAGFMREDSVTYTDYSGLPTGLRNRTTSRPCGPCQKLRHNNGRRTDRAWVRPARLFHTSASTRIDRFIEGFEALS
jgi:hypothetical protein